MDERRSYSVGSEMGNSVGTISTGNTPGHLMGSQRVPEPSIFTRLAIEAFVTRAASRVWSRT